MVFQHTTKGTRAMFLQNVQHSLVLLIFGSLIGSVATAADKTDVVVFSNGDRLTGEIKGLERGRLSFKTAATDTIRIEWDEVAHLTSDQRLEIDLESGQRYFGSLNSGDTSGSLNVRTDSGITELAMPESTLR